MFRSITFILIYFYCILHDYGGHYRFEKPDSIVSTFAGARFQRKSYRIFRYNVRIIEKIVLNYFEYGMIITSLTHLNTL